MIKVCEFCKEPIDDRELYWVGGIEGEEQYMHGNPCWNKNTPLPKSPKMREEIEKWRKIREGYNNV
jgi:hypothetical protein